jgi:thiamine transporter ThiT
MWVVKSMNDKLKRLILASVFLALGAVLPLFTMQIKEIGDSLLPMHLPVMLCGLFCGAKYGGAIGLILPFFRAVTFGMPPLFPNAVWMALELATYGFVIGFIYTKKQQGIGWLYVSLITAMLAGRVVWGISKAVLLGLKGSAFTFGAFLTGGFADAALGILLQLVLIPAIMAIYHRYGNDLT